MLAGNQKILIISRSFYPVNSPRSFRTTELVKEFARQGHEVTLLTQKDDGIHTNFEREHGVTIKDLGPLNFPKITLNGESKIPHLFKRVLRRGLLQLFEYPDIALLFKVKKALSAESGYDLLISIAVPHPIHWGAAWAWRKENSIAKTWVADCGDPYMGQNLDSFDKMPYFKYFEKSFCSKADYISVPLEDAKDGYYSEFRDKMEVIPQGFKFGEVEIDHSSYTKHRIPTFAYAGSFILGGRDPRPFLDHLVSTKRDFKFILYTKNVALIKPWLDRTGGEIEVREYIPREQLLKRLSKMDFLVNFENQSSLMMPSKLIDYYLAGRPVLNVSGDRVDTDKIDRFLEGNYMDKLVYNGIDRYRIENVCRQFLDLCNQKETTNGRI
jgi:hypothetical protein